MICMLTTSCYSQYHSYHLLRQHKIRIPSFTHCKYVFQGLNPLIVPCNIITLQKLYFQNNKCNFVAKLPNLVHRPNFCKRNTSAEHLACGVITKAFEFTQKTSHNFGGKYILFKCMRLYMVWLALNMPASVNAQRQQLLQQVIVIHKMF